MNSVAIPDRTAVDHQPRSSGRDQVDEIVTAVALQSCVSEQELVGRSRSYPIARARHEVWRRVRAELGWSYLMIGRRFGVDHTTVMSALKGNKRKGASAA